MGKPICSINDCGRTAATRTWCHAHYARWWKYGDPLITKRLYRAPLEQRLLSKLVRADTGCLEFIGYRNRHGYGRIKTDGRMPRAHRVAYTLWVGEIPEGYSVCHRCDNPPCCEPSHLFVGTTGDNVADMRAKGRDRSDHGRGGLDGAEKARRAAERRRRIATEAGYPSEWKRCAKCETFKSPDDFGPNRARPDGLQTYCRPCLTEIKGGP